MTRARVPHPRTRTRGIHRRAEVRSAIPRGTDWRYRIRRLVRRFRIGDDQCPTTPFDQSVPLQRLQDLLNRADETAASEARSAWVILLQRRTARRGSCATPRARRAPVPGRLSSAVGDHPGRPRLAGAVSVSTIEKVLQSLERDGLVERRRGHWSSPIRKRRTEAPDPVPPIRTAPGLRT